MLSLIFFIYLGLMENFKNLKEEFDTASANADKFYIDENMQAGKRLFASLMKIERKCKEAREELSSTRKKIREQRQQKNDQEKKMY